MNFEYAKCRTFMHKGIDDECLKLMKMSFTQSDEHGVEKATMIRKNTKEPAQPLPSSKVSQVRWKAPPNSSL